MDNFKLFKNIILKYSTTNFCFSQVFHLYTKQTFFVILKQHCLFNTTTIRKENKKILIVVK